MTNPYRAMCAELVAAVDLLCGSGDSPGQPGSRLILTVHVEALDELADRARALLAQPPADGEVAELVEWLRESLDCALQSGNSKSIKNHCRLLEVLERLASDNARLASDNAGLTAAADSLWADNVSLLDN